MFDVLAGFYGSVVVEVGREVAVTANLCSPIGEQQEAEKDFKTLFLCVGAGVGGTRSGRLRRQLLSTGC